MIAEDLKKQQSGENNDNDEKNPEELGPDARVIFRHIEYKFGDLAEMECVESSLKYILEAKLKELWKKGEKAY